MAEEDNGERGGGMKERTEAAASKAEAQKANV